MKAVEVIKIATEELGLLEIYDKLEKFEKDCNEILEGVAEEVNMAEVDAKIKALEKEIFEEDQQKDLRRLINALNLATEKVSMISIADIKSEVFQTDVEGKISLDLFDGEVLNVLNCVDIVSGRSVDYLLMPFHLYLPKAERTFLIKYRTSIKKVSSLLDEVEVSKVLQSGILARGVVAEYLLGKNCYDEAEFWRSSFEESLKWAVVKNSNRKLKSNPL